MTSRVLAREGDSEREGRVTISIQGKYDVCNVMDRGRRKRRASRIFTGERIVARGRVQHNEETQDLLRVQCL